MSKSMEQLSPAGLSPQLQRLVLTGFMGAGKSTIGDIVARRLRWKFLDLDRLIEKECAATVAEIFRSRGEPYFRARERDCLERLLFEESIVIALGGGTIEDPEVLSSLLQRNGTCLVFLDAPLRELLGRMDPASRTRPLLTNLEELEVRHRRRLPSYRSAHITIETTGLTPAEAALRVLDSVASSWQMSKDGNIG
jgi:shikimate kinase